MHTRALEISLVGDTAVLALEILESLDLKLERAPHEGTTAIPMTLEWHQGKFKNSKGVSLCL